MFAKHILLVEDEKRARSSLTHILQRAGYHVSVAENGNQALALVEKSSTDEDPVDLLLTDIQMPEMSGIELIDRLKEVKDKPMIVGISGYGSKDMVLELMRRGCQEFVDKPFTGDELLSIIEKTFKKQEKERAKEKQQAKTTQELAREIESCQVFFKKLRSEIDSARKTHQQLISIRPTDSYSIPLYLHRQPLFELGGDFVGINDVASRVDVLLADVAGHDLGASYHSILVKSLFDEGRLHPSDGETFMYLLNNLLYDEGRNDRMVTAAHLSLNLENKTCQLVSAAHPPVLHWHKKDEAISCLELKGDPLGIFANIHLETGIYPIESGDKLFLCTDGATAVSKLDMATGIKTPLTIEGLSGMISQHASENIFMTVEKTWKDMMDYCRFKITDDTLLLGVEIP
ncbi:MAG: hypothetical protein A2X49_12360 [Lentisphaerae bacterium GWF2_52_8]|nr:MAG: hypothetical protein A2X49_12360 [Lentisphaerae bacterium GWF2_52_8]